MANWIKSGDKDQLERDVEQTLEKRPLIKHCHELVRQEINTALLKVSTRLGYRHLTLNRRDEVGRVLSLELAKITGVWGKVGSVQAYEKIKAGEIQLNPINIPAAVANLRFCWDRRVQMERELAAIDPKTYDIIFEDAYANPVNEANHEIVCGAVEFLGMYPEAFPDFTKRLTEVLTNKGQNSARIIDFVPNIQETRAALTAAWDEVSSRM